MAVSNEGSAPPYPEQDGIDGLADTFFALADALALSEEERGALLDVPGHDVASLQAAPSAVVADRAKLARRLTYANRILQRMRAASAP